MAESHFDLRDGAITVSDPWPARDLMLRVCLPDALLSSMEDSASPLLVPITIRDVSKLDVTDKLDFGTLKCDETIVRAVSVSTRDGGSISLDTIHKSGMGRIAGRLESPRPSSRQILAISFSATKAGTYDGAIELMPRGSTHLPAVLRYRAKVEE